MSVKAPIDDSAIYITHGVHAMNSKEALEKARAIVVAAQARGCLTPDDMEELAELADITQAQPRTKFHPTYTLRHTVNTPEGPVVFAEWIGITPGDAGMIANGYGLAGSILRLAGKSWVVGMHTREEGVLTVERD